MKIKKMVALGTALTMALSLAACGGSEESGGTAAVSIPSIDSIELGSGYHSIHQGSDQSDRCCGYGLQGICGSVYEAVSQHYRGV